MEKFGIYFLITIITIIFLKQNFNKLISYYFFFYEFYFINLFIECNGTKVSFFLFK